MNLKEIKELMRSMGQTGVTRLSIKQGEFALELEKAGPVLPSHTLVSHSLSSHHGHDENPLRNDIEQHRANISLSKQEHPAIKEEGEAIYSPMVGTFFRSSAPDKPPFVKEGDLVEKGSVLCIIEAMKVMNEIKADKSGLIKRIFVEDGHPVEFGTELFLVQE